MDNPETHPTSGIRHTYEDKQNRKQKGWPTWISLSKPGLNPGSRDVLTVH